MSDASLERLSGYLEELVAGERDLSRRLDLEGIEPLTPYAWEKCMEWSSREEEFASRPASS